MVEECASKCTGQIPPHLNFCTPEQNLRLKTERKTSINRRKIKQAIMQSHKQSTHSKIQGAWQSWKTSYNLCNEQVGY
jgi:hypothetical protein